MSSLTNGERELAVTTEPIAAQSSAKQRRPKAVGGIRLGAGNGREAQRLAAVILEVLAGARTPAQAATALSVSVPRYYQLEARALSGLVESCEARARGRMANPDKELASLRRQQERLQRELARQQSLVRMAQRTIGLAPPAKGQPDASASGSKAKKRRRRAVVRALGAARQLQERSMEAAAVTSGGSESPA